MKDKTIIKYLNNTFGVLTVIELLEKKGERLKANCKCNRCGNLTTVRTDHLSTNPKSCKHCVDNLQKEIADNKYKKVRPLKRKINSLKGNAKTRNYEFNLTEKQVEEIINKPCHYCGDNENISIDRIDSLKPYNIDNVLPCCPICNRMKNKYSYSLFLEKIRKIYEKHLK